MAQSTGAAAVALEALEALYELGGEVEVSDVTVLRALESVGVVGVPSGYASLLATIGTLLRLLLRHGDVPAEVLFAAARQDLQVLGRDIDDRTFDGIVAGLGGAERGC